MKKIEQHLHNSFRSLLLHRLRTILSTLGILFGVAAVVAMLSIGEGAKKDTLEQIQLLGMNNLIIRQLDLTEDQYHKARKNLSQGLTLEDAHKIANGIPYILTTAPLKIVEGSILGTQQEVSPEILAVTREYGDLKGLSLQEGRFICDEDVDHRHLVCVLGAETAQKLGANGRVGQPLRLEHMQYQIVGVLNPRHWKAGKSAALTSRNLNKSLFIPLGTHKGLSKKIPPKDDELSEINLQITSNSNMHNIASAVKRVLEVSHGKSEDYQIVIPQELLQQASHTQKTFNLVLGSIAAISLLVGGIGIMNIMLASVSERTREIGIRRAVGANKSHILIQFLVETLVLTLGGAFLGVVTGVVFSHLIGKFADWTTVITGWSLLISIGMAAGVGLFSGIYPAIKAANMNPIRALRHD